MGEAIFKDFTLKDAMYSLFREDLLNNNKGTKLFGSLGKIIYNKD